MSYNFNVRPALGTDNMLKMLGNSTKVFTSTAKMAAFTVGATEATRVVGFAAKEAMYHFSKKIGDNLDYGGHATRVLTNLSEKIVSSSYANSYAGNSARNLAVFGQKFFNPSVKNSAQMVAWSVVAVVALGAINRTARLVVDKGQNKEESNAFALASAALGSPNAAGAINAEKYLQHDHKTSEFTGYQSPTHIFADAQNMLVAASMLPRAVARDLFAGVTYVSLNGSELPKGNNDQV
jgi:hypothetical protein